MTDPHDPPTGPADVAESDVAESDVAESGDAGGWVILQTSVRPSVRQLARSVCNGVTRATGERFTLRQFLTEAVEQHAARMAERYNGGHPWPSDPRPLPPGRGLAEPGPASGGSSHDPQ